MSNWDREVFTCGYCEQCRDIDEHIMVPIPALDDTLAVCVYCVAEHGTDAFKAHITEHGDQSGARSGRGIVWSEVVNPELDC